MPQLKFEVLFRRLPDLLLTSEFSSVTLPFGRRGARFGVGDATALPLLASVLDGCNASEAITNIVITTAMAAIFTFFIIFSRLIC